MLEIYNLDQNAVQKLEPILTFPLSQLKNGNFVLSSVLDYPRLASALKKWGKIHFDLPELDNVYETFKDLHLKPTNNTFFWENEIRENNSHLLLGSSNTTIQGNESQNVTLDLQD